MSLDYILIKINKRIDCISRKSCQPCVVLPNTSCLPSNEPIFRYEQTYSCRASFERETSAESYFAYQEAPNRTFTWYVMHFLPFSSKWATLCLDSSTGKYPRVINKNCHKKCYRNTKVLPKKLLVFIIYYSWQIYHLSNLLALYYHPLETLLQEIFVSDKFIIDNKWWKIDIFILEKGFHFYKLSSVIYKLLK